MESVSLLIGNVLRTCVPALRCRGNHQQQQQRSERRTTSRRPQEAHRRTQLGWRRRSRGNPRPFSRRRRDAEPDFPGPRSPDVDRRPHHHPGRVCRPVLHPGPLRAGESPQSSPLPLPPALFRRFLSKLQPLFLHAPFCGFTSSTAGEKCALQGPIRSPAVEHKVQGSLFSGSLVLYFPLVLLRRVSSQQQQTRRSPGKTTRAR